MCWGYGSPKNLSEVWRLILKTALCLDIIKYLLQFLIFKPPLQAWNQSLGLLSSLWAKVGQTGQLKLMQLFLEQQALGKISREASSSTSPACGSLPPAAIAVPLTTTDAAGSGSVEPRAAAPERVGQGRGLEWAGPERQL